MFFLAQIARNDYSATILGICFVTYIKFIIIGNEAIVCLEKYLGNVKSERPISSLILLEHLIKRAPAQFSKYLERTANILEVLDKTDYYINLF
jgi:hypothetical protein